MKSAADRRGQARSAGTVSRGVLETAHSLSVDLMTAEVVSAFRKGGIDSILLKGPTIATWLYADGCSRPYGDSDLLVPARQAEQARKALLSMGFRYGYESLGPGELEEGLFWTRGPDTVDLHFTIQGIGADPEDAWGVLCQHTEKATVGGSDLKVLTPDARAMHVALHAAQHGRREGGPMRDLDRALRMLPFEAWAHAADIARHLDAEPAFATGLALLPRGQAIVERLGIDKDHSVKGLLFADSAPTIALTLQDFRMMHGLAPKATFLARKAFPSGAYMRLYWPLARKGRAGLVVAYILRLGAKLRGFFPALLAWNRARRASR